MGWPSKSRTLSVWMNGERVGDWRRPAGRGQEFLYAESWLSSPHTRPISLSMPLRPSREPYRTGVEAFFDNLLPDNRPIRERIQRRFHTASLGAFDLLQEIGRDCVGALQLLPEGQSPPPGMTTSNRDSAMIFSMNPRPSSPRLPPMLCFILSALKTSAASGYGISTPAPPKPPPTSAR